MTNVEILEKAIQKAIDGGWQAEIDGKWLNIRKVTGDLSNMYHSSTWGSPSVLFNHDFAKALWGDSLLHDVIARDYSRSDKIYWTLDPMYMPPNNWQFHLQQMVISDDPLQYLADNLGK